MPSLWSAPATLLGLDGHCGLLTAWVALRHFHRRTSSAKLVRACGYSCEDGIFSVALACALHDHGLEVTFYTDPDLAMQPAEQPFYSRASSLGILVQPAAALDVLIAQVAAGRLPIVLYYTPEGGTHFSILTGSSPDAVQFHDEGELSRQTFEQGWNTPDTLRQTVIVGSSSRTPATPNK